MCPIRPNVVWALDFQFDQTSDGRMLKLLNVIDEFTREALAIDVERSIDADGVVRLPRAPGRRARCTRPTCASTTAPSSSPTRWPTGAGSTAPTPSSSIPGSPWQNAWIESFNGRMRDEHLNGQQFDTLLEAQVLTEDWRIDYNMQQAPQRARLAHPGRVRRGLAQPTTATTRIAGGSTIGVPSKAPSSPYLGSGL